MLFHNLLYYTFIDPKDVTDVSASSIFPAQIDVAWDYDDTGSCWSGFALSVGGSVYHSTADVRERSIGDLIPGETYDVSLAVYANDVDAVRVPSQHPAETPVTVSKYTLYHNPGVYQLCLHQFMFSCCIFQ